VELIAVDPAAKPARLWLALGTGWGRPSEIRPVEDRGDKLEAGAPVTSQQGLEHPCELAADPARNRVILRERDAVFLSRRFFQLDLAGGKKTPLPLGDARQGPPIALDRDGNLYVAGDYSTEVACSRYDPAGKPLPFPATGKHQIAESQRNPHWSRGIAVAPDGTIYVLRNLVRHQSGQLDVYSPDGKLRKADLVPGLDRGSNGLGVDAAGNVYLGVNIKPKDQPYPPEFMGKVPPKPWWFWFKGKLFGDRPEPWTGTFYNPYLYHWGGIVKFGPEGGAFYGLRNASKDAKSGEPADPYTLASKAPEGAAAYATACLEQEVRVTGARWCRPGFGIVASSLMSWGDPCCLCAMSGFAVDPYGRVFHPNPFRFCVEALDTGGNLLARAGRYGNADSAGPKSRLPEPEIPLAWPAFVSLAEGKLYVSDSINQRVVVIGLGHAAEETCEVR